MCDKYLGDQNSQIYETTSTGKQLVSVAEAFSPEIKLIFLYFSKHDCKPCQEFTPVMAHLYEEQTPKSFEVVFMSADPTLPEYDSYFAEMPWLAIPWKDQRGRDSALAFKVTGLPRMVALRKDSGSVVSDNCLKQIDERGPEAIDELLAA